MRTASEAIDAINELENAFPVQTWRAGDIDLWPSYRIRLFGAALDGMLLEHGAVGPIERAHRLAERAARALWRVPLAAWRDRRANAALHPDTSAVFLSDGVSYLKLGNAWFDKYLDPVLDALEVRGLRGLKLTPLAEAHVPRHRPSRFVQPSIDRIKLLATRHPPLEIAQFDALCQAAVTTFGAQTPSRNWLRIQAARLDALAKWFGQWLAHSGAHCAFVNTYYSLEGQAFVQAARRLGLQSIDLQHGMQGPHHVAYARWAAIPAGGYSTLPDQFWVWGHEEAAAIEAWSHGLARHRPLVTGNYWLQRWADDTEPMVAEYFKSAQSLRAPAPATAQVLVCLTWGVAEEETDKLIEAAKQCGPSVGWWWRLHPVESGRRVELAARLQRQGLDGSVVGPATDLPLFALVRSADLVVAHSSTVIQEAATLGVPSVVTSDYGAELHSDLVSQGIALHAIDGKTIAHAVATLAARPRLVGRSPTVTTDLLQAAVDEMFYPAPKAPSVAKATP